MKGIFKFEEDMLKGKNLHINKNTDIKNYIKHWHSYYEIIYYSGCKGECILNGECFEITDDCLFMLTPKDFHEIKINGDDKSFYIIISFNQFATSKQLLPVISNEPFVLYNTDKSLSDKILEIYNEFQKDYALKDIYLSGLLDCILTKIISKGTMIKNNSHAIHQAVREAISYIISNPGDEITLEKISRLFGLAPAYFSKLFHQNTGVTFKKYLNTRRVEYAKRLLEEDGISVTETALECGFPTHSQFVAVFKSFTKMTPSEYRKAKK